MMRKISDLLSRSAAQDTISRQDLEGGVAALIDYRIIGEGIDQMALIARFYEEIDFPKSMRDGNLAHFSGVSGDEIVFQSIWDSEQHALSAYAEMREPIERVTREAGGDTRVERHSSSVYRFSLGDDVSIFGQHRAQPHPDCVGYMIDIPVHGRLAYDLTCEKMNFPADFPPGLLMHVAGQTEIGWRTFSLWRELEQSRDFLERRLMPAAVDVVRDHGIFPEIRPLEVKPFLFALNSRMLD